MNLASRLETDLTDATKKRDEIVISVLRIIKSSIKNLEIEKGHELNEPEVLSVLEKQAKQRQDSIEQYRKGNRDDLADKEEAELKIIKKYLPEKLNVEETTKLIDEVIKELGASSLKDMGQVIKEVVQKANGQAEGKVVSDIVKEKLA